MTGIKTGALITLTLAAAVSGVFGGIIAGLLGLKAAS